MDRSLAVTAIRLIFNEENVGRFIFRPSKCLCMSLEDHPYYGNDLESDWTREELIEDALEQIEWAASEMNDDPCREEAEWLLQWIGDQEPDEFSETEEVWLLTLSSVYRLIRDELQGSAEAYHKLMVKDSQYVTQTMAKQNNEE